jgi:hypothetical protein
MHLLKKVSAAIFFCGLISIGGARAESGKASFEVYGFAHLDYIQDFNRVSPAWDATLRPSRIPTTEGAEGSNGQAILSARQSKLGVQANLPTDAGDVFTKFEFDLFGVGKDEGQTTIRLRHAFGEWNHILAGQTNSVFMDIDIWPNILDYWGPSGMVFYRTPQVRYSGGSEKTSYAVAIEVPGTDVDTGRIREFDPALGSGIVNDEKAPDFTAAVKQSGDWGHVRLAGIYRVLGYDTPGTVDGRPKDHKDGYGGDLTSVINLRKKDAIRVGVVYGQGIASYMNDGGMDLAPQSLVAGSTSAVSAQAVPLLGVSAYYDLWWNDKFSSAFGYSFTKVDNTNLQTGDAFHMGQYASANVIWYPTKNVFYGVEYMYGRREDNNENSGQDNRVQFSAHYAFSSKDFKD